MRPYSLVGQAHGIKVSLISKVPAAADVVDSIAGALGPVAIQLTAHVHARWVVIGRLKVLRFEEVILLCELCMLHYDLAGGRTDAEGGLVMDWLTTRTHWETARGLLDGNRERAGLRGHVACQGDIVAHTRLVSWLLQNNLRHIAGDWRNNGDRPNRDLLNGNCDRTGLRFD